MFDPEVHSTLAFALNERDTDAVVPHLIFEVRVCGYGFSGETEIRTDTDVISHFAEQLAVFYKAFTPPVEFRASFSGEHTLTLRFSQADIMGYVRLECEIRHNIRPNYWNHAHIYSLLEMVSIDELARYLQSVVLHNNRDRVYI